MKRWLGFFAIKIAEWKRVGLRFFFFLIRIGESKLIGDLNTRFIRTRFAIIR